MSDRPVYEIPLEPGVPSSAGKAVPPGFAPTPPSAYGPPPGVAAAPQVPPSLATAPPPSVPGAATPPSTSAQASPSASTAPESGGAGGESPFGFPFPPPAAGESATRASPFPSTATAGEVPFPTAEERSPYPFNFAADLSPDAGAVPFPSGDEPAFASDRPGSALPPMPSLDDLIAAATEREESQRSEQPSFEFGTSTEAAVPTVGHIDEPSKISDIFESLVADVAADAPSASATWGSPASTWPSSSGSAVLEPNEEPTPPTEIEALAGPIPVTAFDDAILGTIPEALRSVDPDLIAALRSVGPTRASDLHITAGSPPTLRVDGSLRALDMPIWDADKTSSALLSALDDQRREKFERENELDWALTISSTERFRLNYSVQRGTVAAAFRIIPTKIKSLRELGMPDEVAKFATLPRGLVLVTGPTGSGKSTTLAALVDLVNQTRAEHIVTVEDPIEYLHTSKKALVKQREVGQDTNSFATALKHVLRQDPDVILIGELRDLETISVALTAAETGHLVFATLHTQSAAQTIDRVIDVFPPHQQNQVRAQLSVTLRGVVCQTLVRRATGEGRVVATEVMFTTPAVANVIREGKTYQVPSMLQAGRELGMHSMDQNLADLLNEGLITYEAALERVQDLETFSRLARRLQGE